MKRSFVVAMLASLCIFGSSVYAEELNMAYMSCGVGDSLRVTLDGKPIDWGVSNSGIIESSSEGLKVIGEGTCDLVDGATGFTVRVSSSGVSSESGRVEVDYTTSTDSLDDAIVRDKTIEVSTVEENSQVESKEVNDRELFGDDIVVEFEDVPENNVIDIQGTSDNESVSIEDTSEEEDLFSDGSTVTVEKPESTSNDVIVSEDKLDDFSSIEESSVETKEEGSFVVEHGSGDVEIVKVVEPELNQYTYQGSIGQSTNVDVVNMDVDCTYESSNEDVATVDEDGNIDLVGTGVANISVCTGNNTKSCRIVSLTPEVDTEEKSVKKGQNYQIEVDNNFAGLPVKYEVIEGEGTVSDTGLVTLEGDVKVKTTIADSYSYVKSLVSTTVHDDYWEAMQPAIQRCLGTPYVFGGETPGVGLDCSAYVSYVYRSVGLMGSRMTAQGIYNISTKISEPLPGDLVFFTGTYDAGEPITHIGIYAGDNKMYHSGNPNQLASIDTPYWRSHLVGYGTMINADMRKPVNTEYGIEGYSQQQLELLWAITAQECSTSYEGALGVISCAMNRASMNYGGYGSDPLSQYTAPNQFCYSASVSDPSLWQRRLGGNVDEFVKQAVYDCVVLGKRNHSFTSFRGNPVSGAVNIGDNWYFNE